MKKLLLVLSLLTLVLAETNTNAAFFGSWGSYNNTASDYPCCEPQVVNTGCRTRCCRDRVVGRPRWTCCKTPRCCRKPRCCKPKRVSCRRYRCCAPKPSCCAQPVPVCEQQGCVTTPNTTCYEDPAFGEAQSYVDGQTVCTEALDGGYPTSYGQPILVN